MMNTADNFGYTSRATGQIQNDLLAAGVSILGFKSGSTAGKAGMQKGDIVVEYDGKRNLTTDKLMALTAVTRPEGTQIRVVFMRDGHEHSTLLPPGPLGISVLDTTMHTSSGREASDVFFSELTDRFKRLGLGTLGAYLVLGLLAFGAAALGFLVIGSWDNLVILLLMMLVAAILLGFVYYSIRDFLRLTAAQMAVSLLFLGWVVATLELIRRSQDSLLILGLMILSGGALFVLLYCFIHFIPSLREEKGTLFGIGIGMWTGIGICYTLWGHNPDLFLSRWLLFAWVGVCGYIGYRIVDEKNQL
jgi:hypothetical protein